jgi:hypothetical protein
MKMVSGVVVAVMMMTGVSAVASPSLEVGKKPQLRCNWTEPFYGLVIDGKKVYDGDPSGVFQAGDDVTFYNPLGEEGDETVKTTVLDASPLYGYIVLKFDLGKNDGVKIIHVDTNTKGSDGMSDHEYEMSASLIDPDNMGATYIGGCDFGK